MEYGELNFSQNLQKTQSISWFASSTLCENILYAEGRKRRKEMSERTEDGGQNDLTELAEDTEFILSYFSEIL